MFYFVKKLVNKTQTPTSLAVHQITSVKEKKKENSLQRYLPGLWQMNNADKLIFRKKSKICEQIILADEGFSK